MSEPYTVNTLKKIMADLPQRGKKDVAVEAVKLVNRGEYTTLLKAILLASLLILDEQVNVHWEDEVTPVIEFLW
jgi:hypothetical protein